MRLSTTALDLHDCVCELCCVVEVLCGDFAERRHTATPPAISLFYIASIPSFLDGRLHTEEQMVSFSSGGLARVVNETGYSFGLLRYRTRRGAIERSAVISVGGALHDTVPYSGTCYLNS